MDELFADKPVVRPTHLAALPDDEILAQCQIKSGKSSGPGGQRRNKVETHATVTHTPTGLSGQAGERRFLEENKKVALRRLRLTLAVEVRTAVPAGDIRSALWRERTRDRKIACSTTHHDYPSMLAEAMDVLAACGWEPGKGGAGTRLEVSASQLVKLICAHKPAMVKMNQERQQRGLRALRG